MSRSVKLAAFGALFSVLAFIAFLVNWNPNSLDELTPVEEAENSFVDATETKTTVATKVIKYQISGGDNNEDDSNPFLKDDPFFVYDPTVEGFNDESQSYGTQNKVGVRASVWNGYPDEIADFLVIGAANEAREQFLVTVGKPKVRANSTWRVMICESAFVQGQERVLVIANAGLDINYQGQTLEKMDGGKVCEIWALDSSGPNPTLLDRTDWFFKGLQTHQEAPVPRPLVPHGSISGPFGNPEEFMGNDNLQKIGLGH